MNEEANERLAAGAFFLHELILRRRAATLLRQHLLENGDDVCAQKCHAVTGQLLEASDVVQSSHSTPAPKQGSRIATGAPAPHRPSRRSTSGMKETGGVAP